ncbi:hypothetical protein NVP1090B_28 [Vibrio phage 1.090.B._10N.286.48.F1]|nr:hypothetical protein NVP1090B_28 [Vibrio phage 1.090.B._10N.286.48.F1]
MSNSIKASVNEDTVTTYTARCGKCGTELKQWVDDYTLALEIRCECCNSINEVSVAY